MNLIEARKAAHNGWVRSPTRTDGLYIRFNANGYQDEKGGLYGTTGAADLDSEDWEPMPKPPLPFESE